MNLSYLVATQFTFHVSKRCFISRSVARILYWVGGTEAAKVHFFLKNVDDLILVVALSAVHIFAILF